MKKNSFNPGNVLKLFIGGMCMGAADVVPGVSGGTIAFILGIYEELLNGIKAFGSKEFLNALRQFRIKEAMRIVNFPFLFVLGLGVLTSILTLASVLENLLKTEPILVWAFFFGLVLASIITIIMRLRKWQLTTVIALIIGAVGAYMLVGLVPVNTPNTWWFLILSGAIAICAMILPGISGSFLLLLLGKYQFVLESVNKARGGDIPSFFNLFFVAVGAGVGLILFARVVSWIFEHHHDLAIASLTGLMIGSLRKVWPWHQDVKWLTDNLGALILDSHGEKIAIAQEAYLPSWSNPEHTVLLSIVLMVAGAIAVFAIEWLGSNVNLSEK